MARSGISEGEVRQVIKKLEGKGIEPTVTLIRRELGTGSYSTISAVLGSWKAERDKNSRPAVPELPADILALCRELWGEAWRSADALAEGEREKHAREKLALEKSIGEMTGEITRLEQALSSLQGEQEVLKKTLQAKENTIQQTKLDHARAESAFQTAQEELRSLRENFGRVQSQLPSWIERATRAETKLEEINEKKKR